MDGTANTIVSIYKWKIYSKTICRRTCALPIKTGQKTRYYVKIKISFESVNTQQQTDTGKNKLNLK
jgi:hypothetical protein